MNRELPHHLQATADMLSRSLKPCSQELAPSVPASLLSDLSASGATSSAAPVERISWVDRLRSVFAAPAFGLAAAALVVIGFLAPAMVSGPQRLIPSTETFRGAQVVHSSSDASIVLITENPAIRQLLQQSGLFDMDAVVETADPLVAASIPTAKLLVDVNGGTMVAYNAESREVLADDLPTDRSKLAERIALAFAALQ